MSGVDEPPCEEAVSFLERSAEQPVDASNRMATVTRAVMLRPRIEVVPSISYLLRWEVGQEERRPPSVVREDVRR